jgi:hypothetical protein
MTKIYDQHDAAFRNVSAYVVLKGDKVVAKVAIKRGASGLRTTAFVHWLGVPMVKGVANGGGYDKDSASVAAAARNLPDDITGSDYQGGTHNARAKFIDAAVLDGGKRWDAAIRDAGFQVWQAV